MNDSDFIYKETFRFVKYAAFQKEEHVFRSTFVKSEVQACIHDRNAH